MPAVAPPVPDPARPPKPAAEMAAEGDHEGPVLTDGAESAYPGEPEPASSSAPIPPNGD